jgi:CheY-like chemotaxis protein
VGVSHSVLEILLVEDHPDTAAAMKRLLESLGHRVQCAANAAEAQRAVAARGFDLLVSDIGLPDINGYDLLPKLRALNDIDAAIALTGFGMEDDLTRSAAAGFDFHLTKPVNFQRLSSYLRKTLARRARD